VAKAKLARVLKRDGGRCGIHAGGCREELTLKDATQDEMIPRRFFRYDTEPDQPDWYGDWNTQPMHRECNQKRDPFPRFECMCHVLYVDVEDKTAYILYKHSEGGWSQHKLYRNAVGDSPSVNITPAPLNPELGLGTRGYLAPGHLSPNHPGIGVMTRNWLPHEALMSNYWELLRAFPILKSLIRDFDRRRGRLPHHSGYRQYTLTVARADDSSSASSKDADETAHAPLRLYFAFSYRDVLYSPPGLHHG